jgi:hypothetical protein
MNKLIAYKIELLLLSFVLPFTILLSFMEIKINNNIVDILLFNDIYISILLLITLLYSKYEKEIKLYKNKISKTKKDDYKTDIILFSIFAVISGYAIIKHVNIGLNSYLSLNIYIFIILEVFSIFFLIISFIAYSRQKRALSIN